MARGPPRARGLSLSLGCFGRKKSFHFFFFNQSLDLPLASPSTPSTHPHSSTLPTLYPQRTHPPQPHTSTRSSRSVLPPPPHPLSYPTFIESFPNLILNSPSLLSTLSFKLSNLLHISSPSTSSPNSPPPSPPLPRSLPLSLPFLFLSLTPPHLFLPPLLALRSSLLPPPSSLSFLLALFSLFSCQRERRLRPPPDPPRRGLTSTA